MLKTDESFKLIGKYAFSGSLGIVGLADGSFLQGLPKGTSLSGKAHMASLFVR